MSFFSNLFSKEKKSAQIAKDRLTIMLAHERTDCRLPYMEDMRNEIIEVIKKYTKVENVTVKSNHNNSLDVLEVEIVLGK